MSDHSPQTQATNWRARAIMTGGLVGSLLGIGAAYLYVRAADETSDHQAPNRPPTREAVKVSMQLVTLLRQIAELGAGK